MQNACMLNEKDDPNGTSYQVKFDENKKFLCFAIALDMKTNGFSAIQRKQVAAVPDPNADIDLFCQCNKRGLLSSREKLEGILNFAIEEDRSSSQVQAKVRAEFGERWVLNCVHGDLLKELLESGLGSSRLDSLLQETFTTESAIKMSSCVEEVIKIFPDMEASTILPLLEGESLTVDSEDEHLLQLCIPSVLQLSAAKPGLHGRVFAVKSVGQMSPQEYSETTVIVPIPPLSQLMHGTRSSTASSSSSSAAAAVAASVPTTITVLHPRKPLLSFAALCIESRHKRIPVVCFTCQNTSGYCGHVTMMKSLGKENAVQFMSKRARSGGLHADESDSDDDESEHKDLFDGDFDYGRLLEGQSGRKRPLGNPHYSLSNRHLIRFLDTAGVLTPLCDTTSCTCVPACPEGETCAACDDWLTCACGEMWNGHCFSDQESRGILYVLQEVVEVTMLHRQCQQCGEVVLYDGLGDHLTVMGTLGDLRRVLFTNMDLQGIVARFASSSDPLSTKLQSLTANIAPSQRQLSNLPSKDLLLKMFWSYILKCVDLDAPTDARAKCTGTAVAGDGMAAGCLPKKARPHFARPINQKPSMRRTLISSASASDSTATSEVYVLYKLGLLYEDMCFVTGRLRKLLDGLFRDKEVESTARRVPPFSVANQQELDDLINRQSYDARPADKSSTTLRSRIYGLTFVADFWLRTRQAQAMPGEHTLALIRSIPAHNVGAMTCSYGPLAVVFSYAALANGMPLNTLVPPCLIHMPHPNDVLFRVAEVVLGHVEQWTAAEYEERKRVKADRHARWQASVAAISQSFRDVVPFRPPPTLSDEEAAAIGAQVGLQALRITLNILEKSMVDVPEFSVMVEEMKTNALPTSTIVTIRNVLEQGNRGLLRVLESETCDDIEDNAAGIGILPYIFRPYIAQLAYMVASGFVCREPEWVLAKHNESIATVLRESKTDRGAWRIANLNATITEVLEEDIAFEGDVLASRATSPNRLYLVEMAETERLVSVSLQDDLKSGRWTGRHPYSLPLLLFLF